MSPRDPRVDAITTWLQSVSDTPLANLRPASADASFRRYFRVDDAAGNSFIVMDAPPEKEDTAPFIHITGLIRGVGVNSPAILAQDIEQGFLLLSDLGNRTYLDHLQRQSDILYSDAIDALISMQGIQDGLPAYDSDKLLTEMGLFEQWYVGRHLESALSEAQQAVLNDTMQLLVDNALQQPQVFVHRDYHSRNLMLTDDNSPGVIDFQDAVIGAITYDLVSLFKDCYIEWPRQRIETWLDEYLSKSGLDADHDSFIRWFDLMGVQRHLKVLGIFCRLYYRDGKAQYLDDLPLTHKYVIDACERYQQLEPLLSLMRELEA